MFSASETNQEMSMAGIILRILYILVLSGKLFNFLLSLEITAIWRQTALHGLLPLLLLNEEFNVWIKQLPPFSSLTFIDLRDDIPVIEIKTDVQLSLLACRMSISCEQ